MNAVLAAASASLLASTPTFHVGSHFGPRTPAFHVGSHLMEGFDGVEAGDPGVEALRAKAEQGKVGGTVLFSYNVASPSQVRTLTRYIGSWRIPERNRPFLIGVDQEGGKVQRLGSQKGFAPHPSAFDVGQMSAVEAEETFDALAHELAQAGINVNFAPVVDVAPSTSVIGRTHRSYGEGPERVAQLALQCLQAHQRHGVIAAAKHFPGLGSCDGDTHEDLADTTTSWRKEELIPYKTLIDLSLLPAIMSTHMVNANLGDKERPLTFERAVMHDLLRDELHFDGVLFTDDLGMGSMVRHHDLDEVIVSSLYAGHDILVFGENAAAAAPGSPARHQPIDDLFERAEEAVARALKEGRLRPKDLAQSARRVASFRAARRPQ